MASSDEIRVVFHEECEHEHTDVHSVVIGICRDDDLVVAEVVNVLLETKGIDQKVQLLVLRYLLAAFLVGVDRLSPEGEYSLGFSVAGLCDCSAC